MKKDIQINFDETINSYIVRLPGMVELEALKKAKVKFENLLAKNVQIEEFSLLFDTGAHEFESIECLKYVRTFLSIQSLLEKCQRFASVAPANYVKAEIKSDIEATFNEYFEAYDWLRN